MLWLCFIATQMYSGNTKFTVMVSKFEGVVWLLYIGGHGKPEFWIKLFMDFARMEIRNLCDMRISIIMREHMIYYDKHYMSNNINS